MRHTHRIVLLAPLLGGCSLFARAERGFVPDPAPVSETLVAGRDTTWVLRAPSYYLLARRRDALWRRGEVDHVAARYRELFGGAPPVVAIVVDSAGVSPDSSGRWRDVLLADAPRPARATDPRPRQHAPSVLPPVGLAGRAARAWVRAVGPADLPDWFESAATLVLSAPAAEEALGARARENLRDLVPLETLFAAELPAASGAPDVRRVSSPAAGTTQWPGGQHFVAQAVSVLAFVRQRDPAFVGVLATGLAHGRRIADLLPTSTALPPDVAALETEWRQWLRALSRVRTTDR